MTHRAYVLLLGVLYAAIWIALAIEPGDRTAWTVQNVALLGAVSVLVLSRRWMEFSRVSYTLIFAHLCLTTIGAHYTYPNTPYDAWFAAVTGHSLDAWFGWDRNNYDRIVHFAYGFLLAYPMREVFLRVVDVRGFWGYALPLDVIMSTSMLFELVEWATAVLFAGGDQAYIGTQGDVWDTHADMALASLGALIAVGITAAVNARYQRDFGREWADSLRVKRRTATDPDGVAWLARPRR